MALTRACLFFIRYLPGFVSAIQSALAALQELCSGKVIAGWRLVFDEKFAVVMQKVFCIEASGAVYMAMERLSVMMEERQSQNFQLLTRQGVIAMARLLP